MPLHAGGQRIGRLYKGSTAIARAYRGAALVHRFYHPPHYSLIGSATVDAEQDITWSAVGIGAPPKTGQRRYVVCVARRYQNGTTATIGGFSIGGVAAALAETNFGTGGQGVGIWWREVPTGTTASMIMSVTSAGGTARKGRLTTYAVYVDGTETLARIDHRASNAEPAVFTDLVVSKGGFIFGGNTVGNGVNPSYGGGWAQDDGVDLNTDEWSAAGSAQVLATGTVSPTIASSSAAFRHAAASSFGFAD